MDPLQDITSQINIPLPDPNQFFATQNNETHQAPALTEEATALCGAQIPKNTSRSNDTALKAFAAFIVEHLELLTPQNIAIIKDANCRSQQRCSLNDQSIRLTHLYVFRDSDGTVPCRGNFNWTDHQLKRLNRLLVLFVAHYKKRAMKQDIMPTTLKAYIIGLQRASTSTFGYKFRLLTDKPFSDMENGLLTVVDNKIRKQQAEGVTRKNHNVLTGDMIRDLYSSSALSKGHAKGFCTRMIFDIAFMTSFRPTELSNIRVEDVTCFQSEDGDAWRIVGTLGDLGGASKTQGGGLKYVNVKPKEVLVWNKIQLDGLLNVYEDIQEYVELIKRIRSPKDKFFTAINYKSTIGIPETFFKAMNLGKNSFLKYVQDACDTV